MANSPIHQSSSHRFVDWDNIISQLVFGAEMATDDMARRSSKLPDMLYYRELRTVFAGSGRQTGKTRWIVHHSDDESLIVASSPTIRCNIEQRLRDRIPHVHPVVTTMHEVRNGLPASTGKFKSVMVDDASFQFRQHDINKFYKALMPFVKPETLFYLIG